MHAHLSLVVQVVLTDLAEQHLSCPDRTCLSDMLDIYRIEGKVVTLFLCELAKLTVGNPV